ncbi:hypothetical protein [Pedobacter foliorum]|uniref:hypothetical protein n=1 Tax=Pedobacter foliorum TaxID=2739058 RepID=UPI0015634869|nr:hypothetical protein [Pedobacter foliorum]NRF38036.1 hypothetical protein [Pedobacter foliorum]
MIGFLYIDDDKIGEVDFKVTDESMGGIGGNLISNENYRKYQQIIQQHCTRCGISNIDNFNFRIVLEDNTELIPQGGIGVTDLVEFDEVYVESVGLDLSMLKGEAFNKTGK